MGHMIDTVMEMETYKQVAGGTAAGGVCFVFLSLLGLAANVRLIASALFLVIGVCFLLVASSLYSLHFPLDYRFEIGERSADHQYGPITVRAKSTIGYEDDLRDRMVEETGLKIRIISCEAFTENEGVLAAESDTQIVGARPISPAGRVFFKFLKGDDSQVQSTEQHIREISVQVKDDAVDYIANGGNDPGIKAALETELGEEWQADDIDDMVDRDSSIRSRHGNKEASVPEKPE